LHEQVGAPFSTKIDRAGAWTAKTAFDLPIYHLNNKRATSYLMALVFRGLCPTNRTLVEMGGIVNTPNSRVYEARALIFSHLFSHLLTCYFPRISRFKASNSSRSINPESSKPLSFMSSSVVEEVEFGDCSAEDFLAFKAS